MAARNPARGRPRRIPQPVHHKARGQARVRLDGRDHYLGPWGSDEAQARYERLIGEWLANGRTLATPDTITVDQLLLAYLRSDDVAKLSETRQGLIRCAIKPAHRLYGKTRVRDFGPRALKACRQWFVSERDNARSTVNQYTGILVTAFKWGVANELVPSDVWYALQAVRGLEAGRSEVRDTDPVKPVPEAFVEAVRPHVNRYVRGMIDLQLVTGMRPGEVVQMRATDLDTTGTVWIYTPQRHKNAHRGQAREVYLGPKGQAIVREFLVPDVEAPLFSPAIAESERLRELRKNRRTPVQPSQQQRRKRNPRRKPGPLYTANTYRNAILKGIAKANAKRLAEDLEAGLAEDERRPPIPSWSPNQLRHNAATAVRREAGLETSRLVLGHSKVETTQIYAERDRERAVAFVLRHG